MTSKERYTTALALAFFFHFLLLRQDMVDTSPMRPAARISVDLENIPSPLAGSKPGISVTSHNEPSPEAKAADMRRKAFLQFLDAISHEVHIRRLENERQDLIGVAVFTFQVDAKGHFSHIALAQSSGKPALDEAAARAVQRASGSAKRPPLLGEDPIPVQVEVKYQHGLR